MMINVHWRRRIGALTMFGVVLGGPAVLPVHAADKPDAALPKAEDFKRDARQAGANRTPILVFFASETCPYCHAVEEDYLKPMFNSGDYRDKILFRKLVIDDGSTVRDFQGNSVDTAVFAKRYGVSLTPHVKFLDADGRELVPGLLGLMTRDFYAGYLEDAINESVAKFRQAKAAVSAPTGKKASATPRG